MKNLGLAALLTLSATASSAMTAQQAEAMGPTLIAAKGYTCARVLSVTPTGRWDVWNVTCAENQNGSRRATYSMNAMTGIVFPK